MLELLLEEQDVHTEVADVLEVEDEDDELEEVVPSSSTAGANDAADIAQYLLLGTVQLIV